MARDAGPGAEVPDTKIGEDIGALNHERSHKGSWKSKKGRKGKGSGKSKGTGSGGHIRPLRTKCPRPYSKNAASSMWKVANARAWDAQRFSCKIASCHTRINVAPWLSTSLKFSFAKKGDGDWVGIESMKPSDFEPAFEGEKMDYVMAFLIPDESIDHRATSLFCSVTQFPTGKGCTLSLDQSAAQHYMAADVGKGVDLHAKKPMDTAQDVTMNVPKTRASFMQVDGIQFTGSSEGPNFHGTVFKVKDNHSMAKLQAIMTKEHINLIGVIDRQANEKD